MPQCATPINTAPPGYHRLPFRYDGSARDDASPRVSKSNTCSTSARTARWSPRPARGVPRRRSLLPLFKQMLFVRTFDTKAIALQRTGKLGTYATCLGHEATHVGIGASMQPEDVFAPSYREYGAQFMRGVQPREVLMYWGGDERGNDFAGPHARLPVVRADLHPVPAWRPAPRWRSSCAASRASRWPAAATAARPRPTSTPRSIPPARTPAAGAVRDQQRLGDLGAAHGADRRRRRWRRRASPAACTACRWTATT